MTENLLESVSSSEPEENGDADSEGDPEIPLRPVDVPEKFWDNESGQIRTDALVKSYLELERKLGSTARHEVPSDPKDYNVVIHNDFLTNDPDVNTRLHAAGFSEEQVQTVYDLAGERLLPMISELASVFEAEQQVERLESHFGGEEKWGLISRQIDAWARSRLPSHVMEALSTTYEGVLAMHQMMTSAEPGLLRQGQTSSDVLSAADLKKIMQDPSYWRDQKPAVVEKVRDGFRKLYGD